MKLNRKELKKIIYDFNSISNRLLQANYEDYNITLFKFIEFIKGNGLIYEYINSFGESEQNLKKVFEEVSGSYGRKIFTLGPLDEEEIRDVFAILNYIVEGEVLIHYGIALGYSNSRKYQDKIKGFNDRVVMILIRHIESYLTKIGLDMGIDEKNKYSITIENGQVNIANDNSTINATNLINKVEYDKLIELIEEVKKNATGITKEDYETLVSSIDVIKEEVKSSEPRKSFLKTAISGLKGLKNTTEFAAAITALIQFIQPFIQ